MRRSRGLVAALIALTLATFAYLAYVSGVFSAYQASEGVAVTTPSPVEIDVPARIASNPSSPAPVLASEESQEPPFEPPASPPPMPPIASPKDDKAADDGGAKGLMECPTVDVADPTNVAAVAKSLDGASDVVVFATQDVEHWRAEFLVNVILNLASVNVTSVVTVGRDKRTCETAKRDHPDAIRCCVYSTWLDGHESLKRWTLSEMHAYVLWLIRYRFALDVMRAGNVSVLVSDSDMWYARNPFDLLRDEATGLGKHSVVANVEGVTFPSVNGGLVYFRADLPGAGGEYLLALFNDHVDDLLADESPPRCHKEQGVGTQVATGAMMDQDILRDAAESAVAGVPMWWSYTHHVCLFKDGWKQREAARAVIKDKHPETKEWVKSGETTRRPYESHPLIEALAANLNESEEKYAVMKVPGHETWTNVTMLAAPKWMFANHGDGDGWFALTPRPGVVFHCMSQNQGIKPRMLRAYHMWDWDRLGAGRGIRVKEGKYLSLAAASFGNFTKRGDFAMQTHRLAALAAATGRIPVLPMIPCASPWLKEYTCERCYAGVLERINVLAGTCPVTALRQFQGPDASFPGSENTEGTVGSPCCYFVPPGDDCAENFAAWGGEMTGEDPGYRPGRTVRLDALIDAAALVVGKGEVVDFADRSWVLGDDFPPDNVAHPTDVFMDFTRVVAALEGDGASVPWVEIDLQGRDALPRVVTRKGVEDRERRKQFLDYNEACPLVNRVSPVV